MDRNLSAEVHILLEKKAGEAEFRTELRAEEGWMLTQGLALLTIKCAQHLGYGIEEMIARLATVLLAPGDDEREA